MSSKRATFIELCEQKIDSKKLLEQAARKIVDKNISSEITYCSGLTFEQPAFVSLARYWIASLVLTHSTVPKIRILYTGEKPRELEQFPNLSLVPTLWKLEAKNKGVAKFNFTFKIQALLGVATEYATWADIDAVFANDTLQKNLTTSFYEKGRRVAGGFYTLARKDRLLFYQEYLYQLEQLYLEEGSLNSDQKIMRKVLETTQISWQNLRGLIDPDFLHLSKAAVKDSNFRENFLSTLVRLANVN